MVVHSHQLAPQAALTYVKAQTHEAERVAEHIRRVEARRVACAADAEAALRRAVELRPDDGDLHYDLGVALGRQGRHAEAERALREAIRVEPDHIRARANVALGLGRQGRHEIGRAHV